MEIRKNKNGEIRYRAKVYFSNGRTKTRTFQRKVDARQWQSQIKHSEVRNELLGIKSIKEDIEFSTLYDLWFNFKIVPSRSHKTISDYKSIGQRHLKPLFGKERVRAIDRGHADHLIKILKDHQLENRTSNKILTVFKQVLSYGEFNNYLTKNPLYRFPALKEKVGRIDYLSQDEITSLLKENQQEDIYPIVLIALNTGMRIGEIAGLRWEKINFDQGFIEVSQSLARKGLKDTKTSSIRYCPMNPEIREVLLAAFKKKCSSDFIFTSKNEKPYNPDHFSRRHFRKALIKADVRLIDFHTLRHTFASQFMMNGGNIYDLQKLLGHTDVKMTMKYAHLSPQHLRTAASTVRFSAAGNKSNSPILAPKADESSRLRLV